MPRSYKIPPPPSKSELTKQQTNIAILLQQGLALLKLGNFNEAQKICEKVLRIQANHFDALQLLGTIFAQTKNYLKAVEFLSKALKINPNYACYNNLGIVLQELKRLEEALFCYDKAIGINPNHAFCYNNRGNVLKELKRSDEALSSYYKAISINPNYADAHYNLGIVLQELKRLEEALSSYDKAISIKADYAEAYTDRGNVLKELKRLEEALSSYDKAISIKADYEEACWNLSLCHLLVGNFKDGWQGYEWRWKNENLSSFKKQRNFPQPLWLGGDSLKGKTILLHAEQGLGDTIQFCRYAALVQKLGAKVILEVQPPLLMLLIDLEGINQILARGDKLPHFDYQCPLMSLPLAFKTELQTIPSLPHHIQPNKDKVIAWQKTLGKKEKLRVGIVWSGSTSHKNDHNRSLKLSQLIAHLPSDYEYVSLQKEIRDADKLLLTEHRVIKHFGNELKDFTDTAALCELMDMVISVDTSVAHLAGTLGKTTWILLPYSPDWRWLLDRDDSPWYPSVKLYRQETNSYWDGVLANIQSDLKVWSSNKSTPTQW